MVAIARGLAELVSEHGLSELILDTKELTVTVRLGVPGAAPIAVRPVATGYAPPVLAAHAATIPIAVVAEKVDDKAHLVTSPFVGTFYRKPNPDSPNYVQMNEKVEKGAVL